MNRKLTRGQINGKLDALRWSRFCDCNYEMVKYGKTCRNLVKDFRFSEEQHHCENCQEDFIRKEKSGDSERIDVLVKRLQFIGLIAKEVYYCDDCTTKYNKNRVEIWVKTVDVEDWIKTVPIDHTDVNSLIDNARCVSDVEYAIVENILTYALYGYSVIENGASNYKLVFEKNDLHYDADIIKFRVDAAVYKVLGFDLEYDFIVIEKEHKRIFEALGNDIKRFDERKQSALKKSIVLGNSVKYSDFEGDYERFGFTLFDFLIRVILNK